MLLPPLPSECPSRAPVLLPGPPLSPQGLPSRLVYSQPGPPSPAVLAAARGLLQLLVLLLALPCGPAQVQPSADDEETGPAARVVHAGDAEGALLQQPLLPADQQAMQGLCASGTAPAAPDRGSQQSEQSSRMPAADSQTDPTGRPQGLQQERLPLGLPAAVLAALEIGGYNTTGTLCQIAGLAVRRAAGQPHAITAPSARLGGLHSATPCCCRPACKDRHIAAAATT